MLLAGWLAALCLSLTYRRFRRYGFQRQTIPHPLTTVGLCVVLVASIAHRFERLGKPGDHYLWAIMVGVTLAAIGVLYNTEFTYTPPWRRRRARQQGPE